MALQPEVLAETLPKAMSLTPAAEVTEITSTLASSFEELNIPVFNVCAGTLLSPDAVSRVFSLIFSGGLGEAQHFSRNASRRQ